MKRWQVQSFGCFEQQAADARDDLRARLKAEVPRRPRRINRFTRMALIAAHRCAGTVTLAPETSLYFTSEHGAVADTVAVMENMLHRQLPVMPVMFTNLGANLAAFHIAASLGLRGRNLGVARHAEGLLAALELACLEASAGDTVLAGCIAECVWPLADHRIRCGLPGEHALAEGSYWLALTRNEVSGPQLTHGTAKDLAQAKQWLTDGQAWYVAPHLARAARQALAADLALARRWRPPLEHCYHPEAVAHTLCHALAATPIPELRMVAGHSDAGFHLLGLTP